MTPAQATFEEFVDDSGEWPPVGRDEWGPTARQPLPQPEAFWTVDQLELCRRGFSPNTLADERGRATVGDWHADDAHRPDRDLDREAELAAADLADQRPQSRPLPPAERAPPEWYVAADPERPLYAQDLDPRGHWLYHDGSERFRAVATGEPPRYHPDDALERHEAEELDDVPVAEPARGRA